MSEMNTNIEVVEIKENCFQKGWKFVKKNAKPLGIVAGSILAAGVVTTVGLLAKNRNHDENEEYELDTDDEIVIDEAPIEE